MKQLILTEKPSVAKSFAKALGCQYSSKTKTYVNEDKQIEILNCIGHLYNLSDPEKYDPKFKNWKNLPVIPDVFTYDENPATKDTARLVNSRLKAFKGGEIIIATDADREGEIIAREVLSKAGIKDHSNIRRFWESQALTEDVILKGIKNAKPLSDYDLLSLQGFARQRADWLCGMNFTRYLATKEDRTFRVGRVQTALLSEIDKRCSEIKNFTSEKYYVAECSIKDRDDNIIKAVYVDRYGNSRFTDPGVFEPLKLKQGEPVILTDEKSEEKKNYPDQLFSLSSLQKTAFHCFSYTAAKTLSIAQKLYEEYKCISYPRTPSSVMGSDNVELCKDLFLKLIRKCPEYTDLYSHVDISCDNRRCFDDSRLEAHHAIIPLQALPPNATVEEENIYSLILERFMLAFSSPEIYEKVTMTFDVGGLTLKAEGRLVKDRGWKRFVRFMARFEKKDGDQNLSHFDSSHLLLETVGVVGGQTRAPKFYNEGSVISFMENPSGKACVEKRLSGLGTPATRHTFVPRLVKCGYIEVDSKKNLVVTARGKKLLKAVRQSRFSALSDVERTTLWEEQLSKDPKAFFNDLVSFVRGSVCC